MNFLVVTGGNTDYEFACDLIKKSGYEVIIAADSGMNFLYKNNIMPDVVVGDFDSVDKEALEYFRAFENIEIQMLNPEKDDTDTEYAIRYAISKGADSITLIGATGTRLDHVMANICLLGIGFEENVEIEIIDKNNRIRLMNHSFSIEKNKQFGKYISLIPFEKVVKGVTLKGMKYNLDDYDMGGYNSLGVSNEIVDDVAEISFKEGVMLVIESKDE